MIGPCKSNPEAGNCFEVADNLKGDLARSYFYLSMTYRNKWKCCDKPGVDKGYLKPWMETDLRAWHKADPVDKNEKARNEIIKNWQNNKNPFIDHPEFVDQILSFSHQLVPHRKLRTKRSKQQPAEPEMKKVKSSPLP